MSQPPRSEEARQRLAAKLRENLARRKAQARARASSDAGASGPLKPGPGSDSKA